MFICMPKINFIIHFFLEVLHFKESCNLIGWRYFGPWLKNQNFTRYGISDEISITILVFILGYFQKFLALFTQIWAKMNVPGKKPLSAFKYSSYLPSCQKSEKIMSHSWEKRRTDGRMDGRTDRQTDGQIDHGDL